MQLQKYLIDFEQGLSPSSVIGVTAHSEEEALAIVVEEIFHNQTVPADYTIRKINPFLIFRIGKDLVRQKHWKQRGIWYPAAYRTKS